MDKTKGLSFKAIGLFSVMYKYPGISRVVLLNDYKDGDIALRSAYRELMNADLINKESGGTYYIPGRDSIPVRRLKPQPIKSDVPKEKKEKRKVTKISVKDGLQFYEDEADKIMGSGHANEKGYWGFIQYLKGANPRSAQLDHILQIREPMGFENYGKLLEASRKRGRSIEECMDAMANDEGYTKSKVNLYATLLKWINKTW